MRVALNSNLLRKIFFLPSLSGKYILEKRVKISLTTLKTVFRGKRVIPKKSN